MKCFQCQKDVMETPLFRQNEKGVQGIWACKEHNTQELDPLVEEITDIIEKDNNGTIY